MDLYALFDQVPKPTVSSQGPVFAVRSVAGFPNFYVGRDSEDRPALLIDTWQGTESVHVPPIRLSDIDAQFDVPCLLQQISGPDEGRLTIIRCRSTDPVTSLYFLRACESLVHILERTADSRMLSNSVIRLAAIFQKLQAPQRRSVNGLFGELLVIWSSADPAYAVSIWRQDPTARFDFSGHVLRLEVKTTTKRVRVHTFSHDQCNPPEDTVPIVASILIEPTAGGISLRELITKIESRLEPHYELVFKLKEVVAETLGNTLDESLEQKFDMNLAEDSLSFFLVSDIPAIRDALPAGVSDVHFSSDLSFCTPMDRWSGVDRAAEMDGIFPVELR